MIGLKEACQVILKRHPNEYIHVVNEYEDAFQFCMLNNGEELTDTTTIFWTPTVYKSDGRIDEKIHILDDKLNGEYIQHTRDEIESLLNNSRKAS